MSILKSNFIRFTRILQGAFQGCKSSARLAQAGAILSAFSPQADFLFIIRNNILAYLL
jgi:hypothetical protein